MGLRPPTRGTASLASPYRNGTVRLGVTSTIVAINQFGKL